VSANALLHYCDARKSHLASIKCKKPLGRSGLRPGPHWESLLRSPRPPSWWGGGWLATPPQEPRPPLSAFQASPVLTPIFNPPRTKILATALRDEDSGELIWWLPFFQCMAPSTKFWIRAWHRYETKLRHCHLMYVYIKSSCQIIGPATAGSVPTHVCNIYATDTHYSSLI